MSTETVLQPPVAAIRHTETRLHGHTLVDDYAWLRERENPEVIEYLEAENAYCSASLAATEPLQKRLYDEMLSHIKETDVSVPFRSGGFWYYSRTEQGLQYSIQCRKVAGSISASAPDSLAPEEIILDINELAKGESFMAVGSMTVSDDGHLLAYSIDNKGFRQYTLQVKDLRTGELLPERVERVGSVVWAADSRTLFYTIEDEEQKRQYQLFRHQLGTPHDSDVLVYEETDERFNIGAGRTRDRQYLILGSASHTTSEERFLRADQPTAAWSLIAPRQDSIEYYADHRGGLFYIRVNDTGRNFRLITAPVASPGKQQWTELIPHRADVMLEDFDLFADFAVVCERSAGLEHLRVTPFAGSGAALAPGREIAFPEPVYAAHPHINREFETATYRYGYQSLVTPGSVYEYDIATGASTLLKQQEVPGGFDRTLYASERIFATAPDGVEVPVSLVYRKDRFRAGANPLWVYGYGSYGYSLPIGFNSNRLSLLDRGFVLAYAHIRGGGDLGKPWHDAGRLMHKQNTFTDFIAVVEHLTARGYGDPARVSAEGGSAGGLLMGAIANLRPDLFRAIVSHVPFVDVMNTMLDASLPLTVPEYEEWGNPNEKEAFEYMLSYSPYDNLAAKPYPAMLVKTSLYDSQVMYWEPAKYAAKLRRLGTGAHRLLLQTNMSAGHGGASGRYDYLKEIALDYAFLLEELKAGE
ncbi:S9 family peptidase [Paracidobacterium acidisoli]|uniref:S9 family peptidase n=1 Tax=Paracidobacterium acidisoli TaxID=2303751 RepID=A0A372IRU7_9BACT|nr:S9 family peptidase [Paracidobacterium acidisoli]MBT9330371.1 S9 family peptidase [Paracidobacterium acidisoli]